MKVFSLIFKKITIWKICKVVGRELLIQPAVGGISEHYAQ